MGFLNWFQEKLSSPRRALQAPSGRRPVTRREVPDRFVAGDVSEHRFADLTGRWGGFYVQCGAAHPVAANLVVASGRLTGTMIDREMESERSVFERAGLPPGMVERERPEPDAPARDVPRWRVGLRP
jgi:hypothetical protein